MKRALKFGVESADWTYFWRILCPEPGSLPEDAPEYGLTVDSIPTLEAGEEDEEKSKAAFQRTWAVDVLVDLLRLENKHC